MVDILLVITGAVRVVVILEGMVVSCVVGVVDFVFGVVVVVSWIVENVELDIGVVVVVFCVVEEVELDIRVVV